MPRRRSGVLLSRRPGGSGGGGGAPSGPAGGSLAGTYPDPTLSDTDLNAIAALSTTAYGRNLLTLADQAALSALIWSLTVDESGASTANWTTDTGTFSSDGSKITCTAVGRLRYTPKVDQGVPFIFQAEMMWDSTGTTAANQNGGIKWGWDGTGVGGAGYLRMLSVTAGTPASTGRVDLGLEGVADRLNITQNWAANTWHTVRACVQGTTASVYFNGALLGTATNMLDTSSFDGNYIGLVGQFGTKWSWRNIKLWTLGMP